MEWILGIYLAIGLIKTLGVAGGDNAAVKPQWMTTSTGLNYGFQFLLYAVFWPFTRSK